MLTTAQAELGAANARAATPTVQVDSSNGNQSSTGEVLAADPAHAKVGVTNLHQYWTNVSVESAQGTASLTPADPRLLGKDIGGLWAAIGAIPPGQEAVWNGKFDAAVPASITVQTSPTALAGNPIATVMNIVGMVATALGATPSVGSVAAITQVLNDVKAAPDLIAVIQDLSDGAATPLREVGHFVNLLNDKRQRVVLAGVLMDLNISVSETTLQNLLTIQQIWNISYVIYDMVSSAALGHSAGEIRFFQPIATAPFHSGHVALNFSGYITGRVDMDISTKCSPPPYVANSFYDVTFALNGKSYGVQIFFPDGIGAGSYAINQNSTTHAQLVFSPSSTNYVDGATGGTVTLNSDLMSVAIDLTLVVNSTLANLAARSQAFLAGENPNDLKPERVRGAISCGHY